jgi:hypothetical protein
MIIIFYCEFTMHLCEAAHDVEVQPFSGLKQYTRVQLVCVEKLNRIGDSTVATHWRQLTDR